LRLIDLCITHSRLESNKEEEEVYSLGLGAQGLGFREPEPGLRVHGFGFGQGFGFRVSSSPLSPPYSPQMILGRPTVLEFSLYC